MKHTKKLKYNHLCKNNYKISIIIGLLLQACLQSLVLPGQ